MGFGGTQPSRRSLCFPFYWGIWDLVGSSRQDGETSPLQRSGSDTAAMEVFIFSPAPAGACEASGE